MNKVFVYGTLKSGRGNHRLLEGSKFIGETETVDAYTLYNVGFPYLTPSTHPSYMEDASYPVMGEVYEVDENTEARLDQLEGVAYNHYDKVEINTLLGKVWAYVPNEETETGNHFCDLSEEGKYVY